jgi:hypothetical protein
MKTIEEVAKGLAIISLSCKDADICAEHDVIHAHGDGDDGRDGLTEARAKELEELGWRESDVGGWQHFV